MSPFDGIALTYDETFTCSTVGRYQRAIVTDILDRHFQAGMRVLEIGCGTGVDAVFLAQKGVHVTATDASERMVEMTRQRAAAAGVQDRVDAQVIPAEALAGVSYPHLFDGLVSNFGALNCLSDLQPLQGIMARHLRPGGIAVFCLFGRWCLWEMLIHLLRFRPSEAFRRMRAGGAEARVGGGMVRVIYPSPRQLIDRCRPYGLPLRTTGVGVLIPPSYSEPMVRRLPRMFGTLQRFEHLASRTFPVKFLGDHYCVELRRVG